jgi:hypothetical protein
MKISIGEMIDRYSICKVKSEKTSLDNSREMNDLWNDIKEYKDFEPYIEKLHNLHSEIWDLESDIRSGNESLLGLEEVGRRAIALRDMNKIRINIKNEINSKYNEGYREIKLNHGSEIEPSLIISLTTVPERLSESEENAIKSDIKSLCEQNDNDYQVHFNIPYVYNITKSPYLIPDWLDEYKLKYPHLRVFRTEDMGPPTKMVPTIMRTKNPETILLVVDDDMVYHPDMVTEHRKYQEKLKDSVIAYKGGRCKVQLYNDDLRDAWILCVTEPREVGLVEHYKSVSYKRKLFTQEFFDSYLGETYSDDALISAYFRNTNIKMFIVPYEPDVPFVGTYESWTSHMNTLPSFPILHTVRSNAKDSGCGHPGLLALPTGGRFYEPPDIGKNKNK